MISFIRNLILGFAILVAGMMMPSVSNAQITAMSGTCVHHSDVWGDWDTMNIYALGYVPNGYAAYASFRVQRDDGTWAFAGIGMNYGFGGSFELTSGEFYTGGMTGVVPHANMYSVSADLYQWSTVGAWPNVSQQWQYIGTYYGTVWDNSSVPIW